MDPDLLWHSVGGGAILAASLALARVILDYAFRGGERRLDQEDRRRTLQRDAELRLERVLQDRLAEADRRLERCDAELLAERVRSAALERDLARLGQAYEALSLDYARSLESHADGRYRLPR
jgi:hypothetical protein